jgi:hypothetical protein
MKDFVMAFTFIIEACVFGFDDFISQAIVVLTMDVNDGIFSAAYTTATTVSNTVIKPTATSIIALCFFVEFMKMALKMDMFKWEWAVSAMAKFAIAKAALDIAPDFIMAIYRIGTGFITGTSETGGLKNSASLYSNAWWPIYERIYDMHWSAALAAAMPLMIIFLATFIVSILVVVMAYARMFEILIYIAVSPLAVAFLPLENSGITKRFVLNFASVVLQGVIMLIIIIIFNSIVGGLFNTLDTSNFEESWRAVLTLCGTMLVSVLTLVVTIMKSGGIAKSILGQG